MISFVLPLALSPGQESVEFFRQVVENVVSVFAIGGGNQTRPANLDFTRRAVMVLMSELLVRTQPHVDADDPLVVPQERRKLFLNRVLHRLGKFEVDAL